MPRLAPVVPATRKSHATASAGDSTCHNRCRRSAGGEGQPERQPKSRCGGKCSPLGRRMSRMRAGRERGRVSESGVGVPATLKLLPFALLAASPCAAETAQPSGPGTQLPGVTVTAPRPSAPARPAPPAPQPAPQPGPALEAPVAPPSLLNLNTVAESASRLGLTPRQTPATVEILEQQQIREQGYRTTPKPRRASPA